MSGYFSNLIWFSIIVELDSFKTRFAPDKLALLRSVKPYPELPAECYSQKPRRSATAESGTADGFRPRHIPQFLGEG